MNDRTRGAWSDGTREALGVAAEKLFAEHGIRGVSMRAIGAAAGQANSAAVQYHFKNKRGVIDAIFGRRLPEIEARRDALLLMARRQAVKPDVRALVHVLFQPFAEMVDAEGRNIYGRFLLNVLNDSPIWRAVNHPMARARNNENFGGAGATAQCIAAILEQLPDMPFAVFQQRIVLMVSLFMTAIVERENLIDAGQEAWPLDILAADQMDIIAASLQLPANPRVHQFAKNLGRP